MAADIDSLPVNIIRSKRKTVSIELKWDGLLIRGPKSMSDRDARTFIRMKKGWIEKQLRVMEERRKLMGQYPPCTAEEIGALTTKAKEVLPGKVKHYAGLVGVDYGRITVRNQKTRWGSCSYKGNLSFNCMLMLLPDEIIDSVVVHELCHRKHMDHSAKFYAEVERVLPEYQRCRKWLRENGSLYLSRMTGEPK